MPAFEFNTTSATAICNLESGMGWVWKKDEAEEDNSNPRSDDRCSTTKIVKSHCTTEEVEPGKFIRKCEKTEQILRDCVGRHTSKQPGSVQLSFTAHLGFAALQPSFFVQQPSSVVLLPRYAALQPPTLQLNSAGPQSRAAIPQRSSLLP
ncbi:hypothetical protein CsSME_00034555 [Camellia sinensis var. sinensis]